MIRTRYLLCVMTILIVADGGNVFAQQVKPANHRGANPPAVRGPAKSAGNINGKAVHAKY